MRARRYLLLLCAVYFIFIGGSPYYNQFLPVRVAHHVIMTVSLGLWLLTRLRRGLPMTPLNPLLFGLVAVWGLTSITGLDPRVSLETSWLLLVNVMLFFVLIDLLQRGHQALLYEVQFFIASLVIILSLYHLASWYFGLGLFPGTNISWKGMTPLVLPQLFVPMGVSTWLAAYTTPLTILSFCWGKAAKRSVVRRAFYVLASGLVVVTFLTFSRGGLVALGAGGATLVALFILPRWRTFSVQTRVLLTGSTGVVVIAITVALLLISRNPGRVAGDSLRTDLWSSALSISADHLVLGVGPGEFGRALRDYRDPNYVDDRLGTAHNLYLNTLAEIGIIGLLVIGALVVLGTRITLQRVQAVTSLHARWQIFGVIAALVAFSTQSVFDTFTLPALVSLPILLTATLISGHLRTEIVRPSLAATSSRVGVVLLLGILLLYGVAFIQWDRAHAAFNQSVRTGSLDAALEAQALDPRLNLYTLQVHYLTAQQSTDLQEQISAYQSIIAIEPTWDLAWMNLAVLFERAGNAPAALDALQHAHAINNENGAILHWSRIAEEAELAAPEDIVDGYIEGYWGDRFLPTSTFWTTTPLRLRALDELVHLMWREVEYRVYSVLNPARTASLVLSDPTEAGDWWIKGEATVSSDPVLAAEYFTEAIRLIPNNGDYYASRARAYQVFDPDAALRDLDVADLLGTRYEFPNATRALLASTSEQRLQFQLAAIPALVDDQNFEGVLYLGRVGPFTLLPEVRRPGPGADVLAPWYAAARDLEASGRTAEAMRMYQLILEYAPGETVSEIELQKSEPAGDN